MLLALKSFLMGTPTGYNLNILLKAASREKRRAGSMYWRAL
jgi:hypothetical protein